MNFILVLAFLFFAGSLIGWVIELLWRRFFSANNPERKWINPGFLTGPYLPLYGFSLIILFTLSFIDVSFIKDEFFQKTVLFILMALCITFFEFIAGLIFIKGMKIKLWDYSNCHGNIMGIICPKYTFFWWLLSGIYYFFIHPQILEWLFWFTNHKSFCFVVGFFYGVFSIDLIYSLNILTKLRKFASENKIIIHFTEFQKHIQAANAERKEKIYFWLSTKSEKIALKENLKKFYEKIESSKNKTE